MAIEIKQDFSETAWTMLLYGEAGIGKTTFASWAPKALILNLENGLKGLDLKASGAFATNALESYADVKELLIKGKASERFDTFVVDSVTKLQEYMIADICDKEKKETLADFAYGKGYAKFVAEIALFMELVESLKRNGKNVLLIAHSHIETFQDPTAEPYDRFNVALDKRVSEKVKANVDYVWYMHQEKIVKETSGGRNISKHKNNILVQTSSSGSVVAKTRGNSDEKFIVIKNDESARGIFANL